MALRGLSFLPLAKFTHLFMKERYIKMKNNILWIYAGLALATIMIVLAGWATFLLLKMVTPFAGVIVLVPMTLGIEWCIERVVRKD